jgi:hypothetical protein
MLRPQNYLRPARRRSFWNSSWAILTVNGIISLILMGLVIGCPPASKWISQAVEAEFAGIVVPDAPSTQMAQPAQPTRTAKND